MVRRFSLAAVALVATSGSLVTAPLPAQAVEEGLEVSAVATYRLSETAVDVEVVLSLRNTLPDRDEGGVTFQYFFDHIVVPIPAEATSVVAVGGSGRRLLVEPDEEVIGEIVVLGIDVALGDRLLFGEMTEVTIRFQLPGEPARSEGTIRVNPAYAWFYAWAYGDPGRSEVIIEVPAQYAVEWLGGPVTESKTNGVTRLTGTGIAEPDFWFVAVSARNDLALTQSAVPFPGGNVRIRSWPDDFDWSGFVGETVTRALPQMIEWVGLDWPEAGIEILEAYTPTIYGYAGWYLPERGRIEIGEALDAHVILHEASHIWFNHGLFDARWINEGLAEEYAFRARSSAGYSGPSAPAAAPGPAPFSLNRWDVPTFLRDDDIESELYGYETSWFVTNAIVEEIGLDMMSKVIAAAEGNLIAYRGTSAPEQVGPVDDWRRYLDLLEEVGGSTKAEQLFRDHVTTRLEEETLDRRSTTRRDYHDLRLVAGPWDLPPVLRLAMDGWDFDSAERMIPQIRAIIDNRDDIRTVANELGVTEPSLERMFETGTELSQVAASLQEQKQVVEVVRRSVASVKREKSLFETIGLWGEASDDDIEQALLAFEVNDLDASLDHAVSVETTMAIAGSVGERRVALAGGTLVLLAAGIWLIRIARRPQETSITQTSSSPSD